MISRKKLENPSKFDIWFWRNCTKPWMMWFMFGMLFAPIVTAFVCFWLYS